MIYGAHGANDRIIKCFFVSTSNVKTLDCFPFEWLSLRFPPDDASINNSQNEMARIWSVKVAGEHFFSLSRVWQWCIYLWKLPFLYAYLFFFVCENYKWEWNASRPRDCFAINLPQMICSLTAHALSSFLFIPMLTFRKQNFFWRKVKQTKGGLSVMTRFRNTTESSVKFWWIVVRKPAVNHRNEWYLIHGFIVNCNESSSCAKDRFTFLDTSLRGQTIEKWEVEEKILIAINVINDFEGPMSIVH